MSNIWILENYCGFSKRDHHWWTLFGDVTRAYDPKTLECEAIFDDAYFPEGMGRIEGWALSIYRMGYYTDYTYLLGECEDYQPTDASDEHSIITVKRSIWLPVYEWLGCDYTLRKNPPTGEQRDRFLRAIDDLTRQPFG